MRKGFTLVELSIVLVIIGLLIGGILVAQSMIHTARINAFVRQIQQFDIAVSNFQTKYNQLPGDSSAFGCTNGANTCNNGIIENSSFDGFTETFNLEAANFWPQLQQGGFISQTSAAFTPTITTVFTPLGSSPNSPVMAIGKNIGVIATSMTIDYWGDPTIMASNHNYYTVCNYTNSRTTLASNLTSGTKGIYSVCGGPNGQIPVVDALAIDIKIDDGLSSGAFDTLLDNVNMFDLTGNCSSGDSYNVASSILTCAIMIKMLSQTGTAQ